MVSEATNSIVTARKWTSLRTQPIQGTESHAGVGFPWTFVLLGLGIVMVFLVGS